MNTIERSRTANHYTQENINKFEKLIENENDFKDFVNALWATRKGLYSIIETRPDLRENVASQFHALNHLIDALLPVNNNYEYPPYR